jgi:hypothetical protein
MPSDARPLALDDEIREAIGGAFDSLNFVTVAYNGDDGWPHVSRRGSTQVYGPQQLAIWFESVRTEWPRPWRRDRR